jgi:hypothetical protein
MGVVIQGGTMAGGVTPACNNCGIFLCWDLDEDEYREAQAFWDAWICEHCNGGVRISLQTWLAQHTPAVGTTTLMSRPTPKENTMSIKTTPAICGASGDHPGVGAPGCTKLPDHVGNHGLAEGEAADTNDIFAAASDAIDTEQAARRPAFRGRKEIAEREAARLDQIDRLKRSVVDKDPNPLVPGEKFTGGDMFDGFYAGMIVGLDSDYVAVWSKLAGRVAILPTHRLEGIPKIGTIVAIHGWGSRAVLRRCVVLTADYGWLDAFDDFIVAFQRSDRDWRMSIAMEGVGGDIFALDARGKVASWYPELVAYNKRMAR